MFMALIAITWLTALFKKLIQCGFVCAASMWFVGSVQGADDRREYQHGIEFISASDSAHWLFWSSSSGNRPRGKKITILPDGSTCQYFTHDVYYSRLDHNRPEIAARAIVSLPEAQEPVSAAASPEGTVLLTFEDGSDSSITDDCEGEIQQRYMMFDSELTAKTPLRTVSVAGAHSGHVAAVGGQFVIVYSEGWVEGGGDSDFGTGKAVYLDVVNVQGELLKHRAVAKDAHLRAWWPLIAGSSRYVIVLWQRYVNNSHRAILMYAMYDPVADHFLKPPTALQSEVYYYHYDVQYLASINRYLVAGNQLGDMLRKSDHGAIALKTQKGFMYLLDERGEIVDHWSAIHTCQRCSGIHTHPFVREAQPAVFEDVGNVHVLYPVKPNGAVLFSLTAHTITQSKYIPDDYYWHSLGTDGIFLDRNTAYFASLSPLGLQTRTIRID
jgi:hypothetical protein